MAVADPAGREAAERLRAEGRLQVAAYDVGALGQPGVVEPGGRLVGLVGHGAVEGAPRLAGQRAGQHPGVGLVVGVRLGVGGALHLLGGDGDLASPS